MSVEGGSGANLPERWAAILAAVKERRRFAWIMLSQNAQPIYFDSSALAVKFASESSLESFKGSNCTDVLEEAARAVMGIKYDVKLIGPEGKMLPASPATPATQATIPATIKPMPKKAPSDFEVMLGQTAFLLHDQGNSRLAALMLDVERMEIVLRAEGFGEWQEANLVVPAFLVPQFTESVLDELKPVLRTVADRRGIDIGAVVAIPALPSIGSDWRERLQSQLAEGAASNQAKRSRAKDAKLLIMRDGCVFDSLEEVRVYDALKRAQAALPGDSTISIFPLPVGRVGAGNMWTPDFVVVRGGRVGIIEVDGPHHSGRRGADGTRDRHWRNSGVVHIERILVEEISDDAELDKLVQVFLKRLREH
ncbi:hypothetical protein ACFV6F_04115 [Kitasatospora phosalacinea]|uniref:hypothetical protein n=1 Tax=Kitasatospora phosalacinea TaxID=2065 RepID=UPI00365D7952